MPLPFSTAFMILAQDHDAAAVESTMQSIADFCRSAYPNAPARELGVGKGIILCLCSDAQADNISQLQAVATSTGTQILDRPTWTFPFEQNPPTIPEIVDLFGKGMKRATVGRVVLMNPGTTISKSQFDVLSDAIGQVDQDSHLLLLSKKSDPTAPPLSAILQTMCLQFGVAMPGGAGKNFCCKKRLFGGLKYTATAEYDPSCTFDFPWFLKSLAFGFQEHPALRISYADWVS